MRRWPEDLSRANNQGKALEEAMIHLEDSNLPVSLFGLARCRHCRALLLHGAGHNDNPRWGERCSPLRDVRCDQSFKTFFKNCYMEGAEQW